MMSARVCDETGSWRDELLLCGNGEDFARTSLCGTTQQSMDSGTGLFECPHRTARVETVEQEQGCDRIAGAVHGNRQAGRAQQVELIPLACQQIEVVSRCMFSLQAGQQHAAQSVRTH